MQTWKLLAGLLVAGHIISASWLVHLEVTSVYEAWIGPRSDEVRIALGAVDIPDLLRGEVWRLFTAPFLHRSLLHLAFNVAGVSALGILFARSVGGLRWLAWWAIGELAGEAMSMLLGVKFTDGASGGIIALIMAIAVAGYRERIPRVARDRARLLLAIVGLDMVVALAIPGVDAAAHLGGLLAGLACGWFAKRR